MWPMYKAVQQLVDAPRRDLLLPAEDSNSVISGLPRMGLRWIYMYIIHIFALCDPEANTSICAVHCTQGLWCFKPTVSILLVPVVGYWWQLESNYLIMRCITRRQCLRIVTYIYIYIYIYIYHEVQWCGNSGLKHRFSCISVSISDTWSWVTHTLIA